jgi:hypothetical protein
MEPSRFDVSGHHNKQKEKAKKLPIPHDLAGQSKKSSRPRVSALSAPLLPLRKIIKNISYCSESIVWNGGLSES